MTPIGLSFSLYEAVYPVHHDFIFFKIFRSCINNYKGATIQYPGGGQGYFRND